MQLGVRHTPVGIGQTPTGVRHIVRHTPIGVGDTRVSVKQTRIGGRTTRITLARESRFPKQYNGTHFSPSKSQLL